MSANAFIAEFDAAAHEAFGEAGMAETGIYTSPLPGAVGFDRRAYINTARQVQGEWGQVLSPRDTIDFFLADGPLAAGATFVVGAATYTLQRIDDTDNHDGSLERWVVTHG